MIVYGGDYEHTVGLGLDAPEGSVRYEISPRPELFGRVLGKKAFEASEFSLANTMMYQGNGDDWLVAVPVFPSRQFRHSDVMVRKDSDLEDFSQLRGRRLGLRDYSQTAAVWLRGHLADEYGVDWRDIEWVSVKGQRFEAPPGVRLTLVSEPLETLLASGGIDALMMKPLDDSALPPGERRFRTLLRDSQAVERAYFEATGIFPIMHTVVVPRAVLQGAPWLPRRIFEAYAAAKKQALERRLGSTFLPWSERFWSDTLDIFGGDSHPYGLTDMNRRIITKFAGYLFEQKLVARPIDVDALFAPRAGEWRE